MMTRLRRYAIRLNAVCSSPAALALACFAYGTVTAYGATNHRPVMAGLAGMLCGWTGYEAVQAWRIWRSRRVGTP